MTTPNAHERGLALLATLFALMLLALLALPFAISMSVGAEAASREVHQSAAEQASASVRDLLLSDAALSDPAFDTTPDYDSLAEWPARVELPPAFAPLQEEGRVLLGGEVWDTQRLFALDGVSPLVLANLLGTATRLREELLPDAGVMLVEDAEALPDSGFVWVAGELIRYGQKDAGALLDLERGCLVELGYAPGTEPIAAEALVLDHRCVVAAAFPFSHRGTGGLSRRPYTSVGELAEVERAGAGAFTADELDTLRANLTTDALATTAPTWGRPERVFDALTGGESRSLRVKSAVHIGAGSTIRITDQATGAGEYALVMATETERGAADLPFTAFRLVLLQPVAADYPAIDTVVEPLIPPPVNVNTAPASVLRALFRELRTAANLRVHEAGRQRLAPPPSLTASMAKALADEIVELRTERGEAGYGPFTGWRDFVERVLQPRVVAAPSDAQRMLWLRVYRNLETGRDSTLEMGTAPLCFASGPWVGYRAAASRARSAVALGTAGRHERTGTAVAVPGFTLEQTWNTQARFEEAFRLDRRAPFWTTTPINLGALQRGETGNDPASRYWPHLVPIAYPQLGLGAPRFALDDPADASLTQAHATTPIDERGWAPAPIEFVRVDTFSQSQDPRGHDVRRDGPYRMQNIGPSTIGGAAAATGGRHDRISFPFADASSFVDRFAVSFWAEPQSLQGVTLFDHSDGDALRNRIALHGRDGNLTFEVIDEAGLDPEPGASPAGVQRTASEWTLPLAELQLPPDTPVHLSVSAYGNRPGDLAVTVDGMSRGRKRYVTTLTAPIGVFDPTLANNRDDPPGRPGSERYLGLTVENTDGFPPVGVLRVGTELFEYSGISGNMFQCTWRDSVGGRGARQAGFEHAPSIPVDENGRPTDDIARILQQAVSQGVNINVFPSHPVGAQVELYGYSALLSEDSPMMVGETQLAGALGGFAVARGFVDSPRPIVITPLQGQPIPIGVGLDENWTGDLRLASPLQTGRDQPPPDAPTEIADAFSPTGGYALLVQRTLNWGGTNQPNGIMANVRAGGVEVIRYTGRNGSTLTGVQRAQRLPGDDSQIDRDLYDGVARNFLTDYDDRWRIISNPNNLLDEYATLILWVVPISIPVQTAGVLWDPQTTGLTEWVQLFPRNGDPDDTEWVRYDAIAEGRHLVRANRAAWSELFWALTRTRDIDDIQSNPLGTTTSPSDPLAPPWNPVQASADFIGYVPRLEADWPQIHEAREALQFRGDPATNTTAHPHSGSVVMQCQRLQLPLGNYSALGGRVGRHDRVALVQGSSASGSARPAVEWHTVNWSMRRYAADNTSSSRPSEILGPWPFQLVAFQRGVQGRYLGPPTGTAILEPRQYDRVVKFPSGELPAAFCTEPMLGGGIADGLAMTGAIDEVEVVAHGVADLVVASAFTAAAATFQLEPNLTLTAAGPLWTQQQLVDQCPPTGGLLQIDGEILAYQSRDGGTFQVAANGRGLLNTEPRDHDRGARVHFLSHRPMAILTGGIGIRDHSLPVAALGALPRQNGTVLLGREIVHYAWTRGDGGAPLLEMPTWFPPGEDPTSAQARGLFRGRFGTVPQTGQSGEALIGFPCRFWDRWHEQSDDPELAYAQLTTTTAPAFFRTLRWREETRDARVDVACFVRADGRAAWTMDPATTPDLWRFEQPADSATEHRLGSQASRLEIRFHTIYRPGVFDPVAFTAHGWKTSARVEDVRLDYDGQRRIIDERVTAR